MRWRTIVACALAQITTTLVNMDYDKPRDVTVAWTIERETDDGRRYVVRHAYDRTLEAPLERFMRKVNTDGPGGCWLWEGYVDPGGYGRWRMPDAETASGAHRAAYIMTKGPIPEGKYLDHHDLTGPNGGRRADGRQYCKQCSIDRRKKHESTAPWRKKK